MGVFPSADLRIGGTPLIALTRLQRALGLSARILAKAEMFNLTGSAKDRPARAILDAAEERGELSKGGTIVEATSGNFGISLAALGAMRGYHVILVLPDHTDEARKALLRAYGAELVLTDGEEGMAGAVRKAETLKTELQAYLPSQFCNPLNPKAHTETGKEIYEDAEGCIDAFVAGVGTGGTITGVGKYLKRRLPALRVIAVEPQGSPFLSEGRVGEHAITGIGAGFLPKTLDVSVIDEIVTVRDEDAADHARLLAQKEGVFAGVSSGAALWAAANVAKRKEFLGKTIAVLLPDSGDRRLSAI